MEARSKSLDHVVYEKSIAKSIFKRISPSKLRLVIRRFIYNLNQRKLTDVDKLSDADREAVFSNYYHSEIESLKKLTGMDFSYWRDMNS